MTRGCSASVVALYCFLLVGRADAQVNPVDLVTIEQSPEVCDDSGAPEPNRFKLYAKNDSANRRIAVNIKTDTIPAARSFVLYDSELAAFTEQFPTFYEHRLAPGGRTLIGCTHIYRTGDAINSYEAIRVQLTKEGAVFVDPTSPVPPPDIPLKFAALMIEKKDGGCPGGPRPRGLFHGVNTHPNRRVLVVTSVIDYQGKKQPAEGQDVISPQSTHLRLGCSNADHIYTRVGGIERAEFVGP